MSKLKTFKYKDAHKIINWGCVFDSLTELKFAISILEDYAFLRERISIHFHPGTKLPTDYIRECHRRYTPDFLIRHKETGEAYLVEIKPRAFQHEHQLLYRKEIAENYIRWKGYDWKFKIIYDDEIILTAEQLEQFEDCRRLKSRSARKLWFQEYNKRFDRSAPNLFTRQVSNAEIQFIMFGTHQNEGNYFSR